MHILYYYYYIISSPTHIVFSVLPAYNRMGENVQFKMVYYCASHLHGPKTSKLPTDVGQWKKTYIMLKKNNNSKSIKDIDLRSVYQICLNTIITYMIIILVLIHSCRWTIMRALRLRHVNKT